MNDLDLPILLRDLALNLGALFIVVYVSYFRRHRRWDQVVGYTAFNISLFTVSAALGSSAPLNIGVGFGLFAVLSIVRLRSAESGQIEIGYTMIALVLGLMSGLSGMKFEVKVVFAILLSASMLVIDNGRWQPIRRRERLRVELDSVINDENDLKSHLVSLLGATPVHFDVRGIDFVRETMRIDVIIERRLTQD